MKSTPHMQARRDFMKSVCAAGTVLAAANFTAGLFPLSAFAATGHTEQQTRLLMGTFVTLTASTADPARARDAFTLAFKEMERLIAVFDRHDPGSSLGVLNAQGTLASPPAELITVLDAAGRLGAETEFAFNPSIGPVVDLFEQARSGKAPLPGFGDSALKQALELARPGGVHLEKSVVRLERSGMRLTLDGIAKGHIADAASSVLLRQGITNHMVNAGGDIRVRGSAATGGPWAIGIQHPTKPGALLDVVTMGANNAIATSGSYENYYDRARSRHHLLNHLTGKSAEAASVTVRASTAMRADALATALAIMPPAEALRYVGSLQGVACLILDRHGRRYASPDWA